MSQSNNNNENAQILNLLNNVCGANSFFTVAQKIILSKNNIDIDQNTSELFISKLQSLCSNTYYNYNGLFTNGDIEKVLHMIFTNANFIFPENILEKIISTNYSYKILDIYIKTGNKFNISQTKIIFSKSNEIELNYSPYYGNDYNKLKLLIEGSNVETFSHNNEILILAASGHMNNFLTKCINNKITLPQDCLYGIISSNNFELFKLALLSGCQLNNKALLNACKSNNISIIKFILENKIIPTKECFNAIFENTDTKEKVYRYRYRSNLSKNNDNSNKSDIIDLLNVYGYKITYDDVVLATRNKVVINNFETLGIKMDDKFLEICSENSFYPYQLNGLKPSSVCLQKECSKVGNIQVIKKLISSGITPDIECLRNACKHKNNLQTIKLLIEKGKLDPDLDCIYNLSRDIGNRSMEYLLDLLIKKNKTTNNINNLDQNKIDSDISKSDTSNSSESENENDMSKPSINKDINTSKNKKIIVHLSESETDSSSDEDIENLKLNKSNKKSSIIPSTKKIITKNSGTVTSDKESDDKESDISSDDVPKKIINNDKQHDVSIQLIQNQIPDDYDFRVGRTINSKLLKLFNLKHTDEYSFIAIRKNLLKYLAHEKLLLSDRFKLNKDLITLSGCVLNNDTIHLKDLDKFVFCLIGNSPTSEKTKTK